MQLHLEYRLSVHSVSNDDKKTARTRAAERNARRAGGGGRPAAAAARLRRSLRHTVTFRSNNEIHVRGLAILRVYSTLM